MYHHGKVCSLLMRLNWSTYIKIFFQRVHKMQTLFLMHKNSIYSNPLVCSKTYADSNDFIAIRLHGGVWRIRIKLRGYIQIAIPKWRVKLRPSLQILHPTWYKRTCVRKGSEEDMGWNEIRWINFGEGSCYEI